MIRTLKKLVETEKQGIILKILKRISPLKNLYYIVAINTIKNEKIKLHFAELVVFQVATSKIIHHLLAPEKKLYLFDTFERFPIEFLEDKVDSF
jgi:hypothetical protein